MKWKMEQLQLCRRRYVNKTQRSKEVINLHGFDNRNDACRPEAADGGEHGNGQVVVWRSTVHQSNAGWHLHGMNLAWRDPWVASPSWHIGLTLSRGREEESKYSRFIRTVELLQLTSKKHMNTVTQPKRRTVLHPNVLKSLACLSFISSSAGNI